MKINCFKTAIVTELTKKVVSAINTWEVNFEDLDCFDDKNYKVDIKLSICPILNGEKMEPLVVRTIPYNPKGSAHHYISFLGITYMYNEGDHTIYSITTEHTI